MSEGPSIALFMALFGPHQLSACLSILFICAHHGMSQRLLLQAAGNAAQPEGGEGAEDPTRANGQSADSTETAAAT